MLHGEGNGNLPQYACMGNPIDEEWAIVHRVAKKSDTRKWLDNKQYCSPYWLCQFTFPPVVCEGFTFFSHPLQRILVQFSHSVMYDSLRPHEPQHAWPRYPSPTPNSCPLSQWCRPTISSSAVPFSSCLQSFPVSGSFPVSQFFTSGDQSIGASASASVLPMTILISWIFLFVCLFCFLKLPDWF